MHYYHSEGALPHSGFALAYSVTLATPKFGYAFFRLHSAKLE